LDNTGKQNIESIAEQIGQEFHTPIESTFLAFKFTLFFGTEIISVPLTTTKREGFTFCSVVLESTVVAFARAWCNNECAGICKEEKVADYSLPFADL